MKKIMTIGIYIFILLMFFQISSSNPVRADWWIRPDTRPTQPSEVRNFPTSAPQPTVAPSNPPAGPTATPRVGGGVTPAPTQSSSGGSTNSGSGSSDDPCAAGKSYSGPYCGWSPSINNSGGGSSEPPRIGGPQVLGLSNTSSGDIALSDIMILAGILCLAVYARSKFIVDNPSH